MIAVVLLRKTKEAQQLFLYFLPYLFCIFSKTKDTEKIQKRYRKDTEKIQKRYRKDTEKIQKRYRKDTEKIQKR